MSWWLRGVQQRGPSLGVGDVQYKAHDQLGLGVGDGGDLCSLQPLVRPRPGLQSLVRLPSRPRYCEAASPSR